MDNLRSGNGKGRSLQHESQYEKQMRQSRCLKEGRLRFGLSGPRPQRSSRLNLARYLCENSLAMERCSCSTPGPSIGPRCVDSYNLPLMTIDPQAVPSSQVLAVPGLTVEDGRRCHHHRPHRILEDRGMVFSGCATSAPSWL